MGKFIDECRSTVMDVWRSQITTAVLCLSLLVCALGWWFEVRPLAPVWGPVGTWVGGIATSLGLLFTGKQIRDANRQRAQDEQRRQDEEVERREAMARAVSVSSSLAGREGEKEVIEYVVVNGSDYPIDNVVIRINDPGGYFGSYHDGDDFIPREIVVGTMYSKQVIEDSYEPREVKPELPFALVTGMATIHFTDPWDQSWERGPGMLEKRDAPPRMC